MREENEGRDASRKAQGPEAGFTPMGAMVAAVVLQFGVLAMMGNFGVAVCQDQGHGEMAVQTATYCQNEFHSASR